MDKPSILIVDSDTDLSGILSKRFSSAGWNVKTAKDLKHTDKELKKKVFKVILFDPDTDVDSAVFLTALQKNKNAKAAIKIIHANPSNRATILELENSGKDILWLKGSISLSDIVKKTKIFFDSKNQ